VIFIAIGTVLAALIALAVVRFALGPTLPDRVVAFDTMNTLVVASMISFGVGYESVIYIDVAIVYALLSYVATLYMANYLEGDI